MRFGQRFLLGALVLLTVVPLLALAGLEEEDFVQNRWLLEKWRSSPDKAHYDRLRSNLAHFLATPQAYQDRLLKLDHDLRAEDSTTYIQLHRVLERYTEWLNRLPAAAQQKINQAPNAQERLKAIRQILRQEWTNHLPRAQRQLLEDQEPEKRQNAIQNLWQQEQQRREKWRIASQDWLALNHLKEHRAEIDAFVAKVLRPKLTPGEVKLLREARDLPWPAYPQKLVSLVDTYIFPGPAKGVSYFAELPPRVRNDLSNPADPQFTKTLKNLEGKWPTYALRVLKKVKEKGWELPKPFGPCRPEEFSPAVQAFLKEELMPRLNQSQIQQLILLQGQWPEYPQRVAQLARQKDLTVPEMTDLPGSSKSILRKTRRNNPAPGPDVPDAVLLQFVKELRPQEQAKLPPLLLKDPIVRERIKQKFFRQHPDERERLSQMDEKKRQRKF
jgi:hypothetical protein